MLINLYYLLPVEELSYSYYSVPLKIECCVCSFVVIGFVGSIDGRTRSNTMKDIRKSPTNLNNNKMGQSASVSRVSDHSKEASDANSNLRASIENQEGSMKTRFEQEILDSMNKSGIKDQLLLTGNKEVQTEYASEFNFDKIKNIVTLALKAAAEAAKASQTGGLSILLGDDVINTFVDLVGAICDSGKTNSSSTTTYSFMMNRLAPGFFVFISNSSVSLKDDQFFGKESVVTTSYYYKTVLSIDDTKRMDKFNSALLKAKTLNILKACQVENAQQFADNKITYEQWESAEETKTKAIDRIQKELDNIGFNTNSILIYRPPQPFTQPDEAAHQPDTDHSLATKALKVSTNVKHEKISQLFKSRAETGYYGYISL
ncbi:hypothetical protein PPL_03341 [Heterostelium album PN500]|uniref:Uncharacterized protein n=1 Tax=Heterostelium pallidum (strain ATCC 26659 / Pp 5 / PN500) TaxID=670386 RepID=D3B4L6_HETP5|nr:hypothetical protein PPL_03341 [Heterostelium album PN500]EFA84264.1 hypothetical protein PPL_03341 [Heterostelium album PN500]|eukprot:XP_020436380.1 hypothetical protein PPL_03341 [Heterostelium album PN500]